MVCPVATMLFGVPGAGAGQVNVSPSWVNVPPGVMLGVAAASVWAE